MTYSHEFFMLEALKEAKKGYFKDEVPVGSIITMGNRIISRGHNLCETLSDPTAHAEMQVLSSACYSLKTQYLTRCTIYTTLEPCAMCAGALFWSQINTVVFGAFDKKRGMSLIQKNILHPKTKIVSGVLNEKCSYILSDFFLKKRKLNRK